MASRAVRISIRAQGHVADRLGRLELGHGRKGHAGGDGERVELALAQLAGQFLPGAGNRGRLDAERLQQRGE